jgi:hypothetical protein
MKFILIISFIACSVIGNAQYTKEDEKLNKASNDNKENSLKGTPFKDRLFTGGNVGFNIYNSFLLLDLAPIVGYKVNENFGIGVGAKFSLIKDLNTKQSNTYYGGSIFGRHKIYNGIFAHSEFEILNAYNRDPNSINYGERAPAFVWFTGLGYSSGGAISISGMLLYDLIDHPNSPYRNQYLFRSGFSYTPIILRIGVNIGF